MSMRAFLSGTVLFACWVLVLSRRAVVPIAVPAARLSIHCVKPLVLTPALVKRIQAKIGKVVRKFGSNHVSQVAVTLSAAHLFSKNETLLLHSGQGASRVVVSVTGTLIGQGPELVAKVHSKNFFDGIDLCGHKLATQLQTIQSRNLLITRREKEEKERRDDEEEE